MKRWNFYREKKTGDYVMARTKSRRPRRHNLLDVVGAEDDNRIDTVQRDMATQAYLDVDCELVSEADVPPEWHKALTEAAGC